MESKESLPWEITIRKASNGFICSWKEESDNEEDYIVIRQAVFEESEENPTSENLDELENMKNLLHFIQEHFGVSYSKHNKKNLVIKIEGEESD